MNDKDMDARDGSEKEKFAVHIGELRRARLTEVRRINNEKRATPTHFHMPSLDTQRLNFL